MSAAERECSPADQPSAASAQNRIEHFISGISVTAFRGWPSQWDHQGRFPKFLVSQKKPPNASSFELKDKIGAAGALGGFQFTTLALSPEDQRVNALPRAPGARFKQVGSTRFSSQAQASIGVQGNLSRTSFAPAWKKAA